MSAFKESQLIGFSIYTVAIVGVSMIPVLYVSPLSPIAAFALRSFGVLYFFLFFLSYINFIFFFNFFFKKNFRFVATIILLLLFGLKCFVILFRPAMNTMDYFDARRSSSLSGGMRMDRISVSSKAQLELLSGSDNIKSDNALKVSFNS